MKNKIETTVKGRRKNRLAAAFAGVAMLGAAGLVVFGGKHEVATEGPIPYAAVCGDRNCEQLESQPYLLNDDFTYRTDASGKKIVNERYCKIDCYKRDGVCDNNKENVFGPDEYKVPELPEKYLDGKPVKVPLEGEADYDCQIKLITAEPCGALAGDKDPLTRPRMKEEMSIQPGLVQFSREQLEERHKKESGVEFGDNYFVSYFAGFEELCPDEAKERGIKDEDIKVCSSESFGTVKECLCLNHQDCIVLPPTCGDGIFNPKKEQCDLSNPQGKKACGKDKICTKYCMCVKKPEEKCGNGKKDDGEECDYNGPNTCEEGKKCNRLCQCVGGGGPVCGDGQITHDEECDPKSARDACASDEKCNATTCKCEEKSKKVGLCPANIIGSAQALKANIGSRLRGNVGSIRSALGVQGVPITVYVTIDVDTNGTATIAGSTAVCGGEACRIQTQPHQAAGITSAGLPTVTAPTEKCRFTFSITLPAG